MICLPVNAQTPPVAAPSAQSAPSSSTAAEAPPEPARAAPEPAGTAVAPSQESDGGDAPAGGDEPAQPPEDPAEKKGKKDETEGKSKSSERGGPGDAGGDAGTFRVRARIFAGFEYEREASQNAAGESESDYGFVLRQARLGVKGELAKGLEVNVTVEMADVLDPETGTSFTQPTLIRTAVLQYEPSRALQLSVGRYKRPFSRLELESSADLPILRRGLWNGLAIEDNQWGDRAVGAMLSGRIKKPKLRWYLSATNPAWSPTPTYEGFDVTGRLQLTLSKPFTLGVHAAYKYIDIAGTERRGIAFGGDLDFEMGNTHVLLDASYADLIVNRAEEPSGMGVVLLAEQRIPLLGEWALAPTVAVELADADSSISQTESLRLTLGLNVLGHSVFRVMPQVAFVRALGQTSTSNPWPDGEQYSLILTLAP